MGRGIAKAMVDETALRNVRGKSTMTEHDPLCQHSNPVPDVSAWCSCPALRLARADERAQFDALVDERDRLVDAALDFAEAVAAKLVRVICEDAATISAEESAAKHLLRTWQHTRAERDAARAEAAALRDAPCAHDMSIHDQKVRRDVLADLRAKVDGLYTIHHDDPSSRSGAFVEWVRSDAVLALIDGADRG